MPLGDSFRKFLDKANSSLESRSSNSSTPPPIPHNSKPTNPPPSSSSTSHPTAYWTPIFHLNTPVSQNFHHETGQTGWGNNEAQNYTSSPTNSFHTPTGQLVVRAIADSRAPTRETQFTSARLSSHQRLSRDAGYLSVRLTAPSAKGIWPAFWLLPAEPFQWPTDGEADIFEAWNGDKTNHTCLHWGHFNGEDWDKHRVVETAIPKLGDVRGREYGFAWRQGPGGEGGMVWYIDGKAVMRADVPRGMRRLSDWRIICNVAIGGDVCGGVLPDDGSYDFVVHEIKMLEEPVRGWGGFEKDLRKAKEGHKM